MPDIDERRSLQSLYPEPQARSGMDARQPTKFTVPFFKLSFLLTLPLFLIVALASLYTYSEDFSKFALAINSIAFFGAIMVTVIISIAILAYARMIIVRNCRLSLFVEALYAVIIFPLGLLLMREFKDWFGDTSVYQMFGIEAAIIAALVVPLVLYARYLAK